MGGLVTTADARSGKWRDERIRRLVGEDPRRGAGVQYTDRRLVGLGESRDDATKDRGCLLLPAGDEVFDLLQSADPRCE